MAIKSCTGCGLSLEVNRTNFGSTPSGGSRNKCRKCMAQHTKAYDEKQPAKREARSQARSERGGHILLDAVLKQRLLSNQRRSCLCCGERIEVWHVVELDHLTPVAKGGTHDESNLAIAHEQCNAEKHAKTLMEHWLWRERLGLPVQRFRLEPDGRWNRI